MAVKKIPDGYTAVTPHIVCAGAADAIDFYARAFGAKEVMRMPGPDGKWRPIVEGNVAELNSTRLRQYGRYMVEQVVKRQNAHVGTECDVVLRKLGLLGA